MKKTVTSIGFYLFIVVCMLIFLFPLYIMFKLSLSIPQEVFIKQQPYLIHHATFEHFKNVFSSGSTFFNPLVKSIVTGIFAASLSLAISIPAAYAIAQFDYRLRYGLLVLIFITRMIPEVSIALPVSIQFIKTGLFDTILGLIAAHTIRILPVSCFILVGVFSAFPKELEKQARVDGLSRLGALIKVILPLSLGGISVAGIFSFLLSWDEFIYASYLTLAHPTMPLKMYYYVSRGDIFSSATYAAIITIPVILITCALQKYIKPGYLSGSIKG